MGAKKNAMKIILLLFTLLIFTCANSDVRWPKGKVYDIMIFVDSKKVVFKLNGSIDITIPNDSVLIERRFDEVLEQEKELVRSGKGEGVFLKGVFIEFDDSLEYGTFLTTLNSIAQIFESVDQSLQIENIQITTCFYGYFIRSNYWATRPLINLNRNDIEIIGFNFHKKIPYECVNSGILDSLFRINIDTCFSEDDLTWGRILKNNRTLRITSDSNVKLIQIVKFVKNIENPSDYIFKFYAKEDSTLGRKIATESLCAKKKK